MLILVCGMHRSGSTLVWQITRQLIGTDPRLRNPRGVSTSQFPLAAADPDDLLMAKIHFRSALERSDFPDEGAKYLYTYRDPRDVVASLYRKGRYKPEDPERGPRNSRLIARRETRGDEFWTSRKDVWIGRYEDFRGDVPGLVRSLADFLDVSVDDARVNEIVAAVNLEAQEERARVAKAAGIDDDLRITSNHITDGREGAWRDTLTADELGAIEAEVARWLVEHDYGVTTVVGRRKTADLRPAESSTPASEDTPASTPLSALTPSPPSRSRRAWVLMGLAGLLAIMGIATAVAMPMLSVLPWLAALGSGMFGAFLWGRDVHASSRRLARRRRGH